MKTNILILMLACFFGPLSAHTASLSKSAPVNSLIWLVDLDQQNHMLLNTQIVRSRTLRYLTLRDAVKSRNVTIMCSLALKIDRIQRHYEYVCFSSTFQLKSLHAYMLFQIERKNEVEVLMKTPSHSGVRG